MVVGHSAGTKDHILEYTRSEGVIGQPCCDAESLHRIVNLAESMSVEGRGN